MFIDLTVRVEEDFWREKLSNQNVATFGHLGTHFDVMDKEFPLQNLRTKGKIIALPTIREREMDLADIDGDVIAAGDFVIFYTGFLAEKKYGTAEYFALHPQLSRSLIQYLLDTQVSMIGIDAPGVRRGAEHGEMDRRCADSGVFVVENLANLDLLYAAAGTGAWDVGPALPGRR